MNWPSRPVATLHNATNQTQNRTRAFVGNDAFASMFTLTLGPVTRKSNGDVVVTVRSESQPLAGGGFFFDMNPIVGLTDQQSLRALQTATRRKQVGLLQNMTQQVTFTDAPKQEFAAVTFPGFRTDDPPFDRSDLARFTNDPQPDELLTVGVPPLRAAVDVTPDGVSTSECSVPSDPVQPGASVPVTFTASNSFPLPVRATVEATASAPGSVSRASTSVNLPASGSTDASVDLTPPRAAGEYDVTLRVTTANAR